LNVGHLFQGHALNAVDAKGRVSVPHSFRALIEKRALSNSLDPDNTLMIGEHEGRRCLAAFDAVASQELNQQLVESVADLPAAERRLALEAAQADAFDALEPVKFDDAGRMVLPAGLRSAAAIEDLAFFRGVGATFQIWSPRRAFDTLDKGSRIHDALIRALDQRGIAL
jgi:MraZ protein